MKAPAAGTAGRDPVEAIPHRHAPLGEKPGWNEDGQECSLRRLPEHQPGRGGADRPHQDARRPVFVEIEDLPGEADARAQRHRADGMQRSRQPWHAVADERSGDVESAHHAQDDGEAGSRRQRVPVRGHEQQHAPADHQRAEGDRDHYRPPQLVGAGMCSFVIADPGGRRRVDQSGVRPPRQPGVPVVHGP